MQRRDPDGTIARGPIHYEITVKDEFKRLTVDGHTNIVCTNALGFGCLDDYLKYIDGNYDTLEITDADGGPCDFCKHADATQL